jgi:hypothetical protein
MSLERWTTWTPRLPRVAIATARLGALALAFAVGCAPEAARDPIDEACGGPRPALEDCAALGVYSADCGGEGEPVLACDEENGACRWFAGACVAARHRASDCPASDPCCHATADGDWPFADGWMPTSTSVFAPYVLREDVATIGRTPVTATTPANLAVTVDPSFVASATPSVECTGEIPPPLTFLCPPSVAIPFEVHRARETFALELRTSRNGFALLFEVATQPGGSPLGRAFVKYEEDGFPGPPPSACLEPGPRALPVSGTLTLDGLADTGVVHGLLVLDVGGGTVTASF